MGEKGGLAGRKLISALFPRGNFDLDLHPRIVRGPLRSSLRADGSRRNTYAVSASLAGKES
jgi:hypothetical protein